jgi:hypothetical protein
MLPIVAMFRDLSDPSLRNYEAVVQKAEALGLEPFEMKMKIPARRDVM